MSLIKIIYAFLVMTACTMAHGQEYNGVLTPGIYGAYMDYSTFTELTLNEDGTFKFIDQFELSGSCRASGKWRVLGKRLILFDLKQNTQRPVPRKWKINGSQIMSKKVQRFNDRKQKIKLSM